MRGQSKLAHQWPIGRNIPPVIIQGTRQHYFGVSACSMSGRANCSAGFSQPPVGDLISDADWILRFEVNSIKLTKVGSASYERSLYTTADIRHRLFFGLL